MTDTPSLRRSVLPSLVPDSGGPAPLETQLPTPAQTALPSVGRQSEAGVSISNSDLAASFRPTEQQALCRTRFWSRMAERPLAAGTQPGLALAQQLTQSASLKGWWAQGGFKEWFLNVNAHEEQVDWLMHLALRAAEDVLRCEDPKAQGARVAMVKIVAEMSGRLASKAGQATAGEKRVNAISAMSKEEVQKLLEGQGIVIERVLSVETPGNLKES